ncbi:uncharacterized protein PG986_012660 [Apiospora aurea]|uniref:Protein kinase domain-containing protein n=1 Tax=Apiospora aurea TaxID=335848 RepID=A0ABR1Q0L7_9PEZI
MFRAFFGIKKKTKKKDKLKREKRHRREREIAEPDEPVDPFSTEGIKASLKKHFRGRQNDLKFRRIIGNGAFGVTALLHDVREKPRNRSSSSGPFKPGPWTISAWRFKLSG